MKKSKSSVPRFIERWPPAPAPPVKNEGLLATAGLPDPDPPLLAAGPLVAIAVGNTKEGESLPANPTSPPCKRTEAADGSLQIYPASNIQSRYTIKSAIESSKSLRSAY